MESYKQEFIDFMVESHVLKFGEFTLKSGRSRRCGRSFPDQYTDRYED